MPGCLLAITLITWGGLTTLTSFVHTPLQLYGARFLLGAAEAGFFPGVIVYLSHWFIYQDRAKAVARFMCAIPIAYMLGGPIAGAILSSHWFGLAGWRWLFLLEGAPAILLGMATLFVLPDRPNDARWLRADERDWLVARLDEEREAKATRAALYDLAGAPVSSGADSDSRFILLLHGRLRVFFLDADDASAPHALDRRSPDRLDRRNSICCRLYRNAAAELEL